MTTSRRFDGGPPFLPGTARPAFAFSKASSPFVQPVASKTWGVGHEEQPLADVRRPTARSTQIRTPDGVTRSFQVQVNKIEPPEGLLAAKLLANND